RGGRGGPARIAHRVLAGELSRRAADPRTRPAERRSEWWYEPGGVEGDPDEQEERAAAEQQEAWPERDAASEDAVGDNRDAGRQHHEGGGEPVAGEPRRG